MKISKIAITMALGSLLSFGAFSAEITKAQLQEVMTAVESWPDESKKAADFMVKKYGKPDGITNTMLVWDDNKPFKRSIVYKEAVTHQFPAEHKDVLEHFISYEAPTADKVAEIWKFDGSIMLERTKGEMSARSDSEEANILALNLADEIIKGKRSAEEAKLEYAKQILSLQEGSPQKLSESLAFTPAGEAAGDPGESNLERVKTMQAQEEKTLQEQEEKPEEVIEE